MQKVLIANRGEIAVRIIRTCKEKNIKTVAVYSEADEGMPFTQLADEAVLLGPPPIAQSYLNGDAMIKIALDQQVDAIHPGYGLLSENATFAQKVQDAGLIWIGPEPDVIQKMGDKVIARQTMLEAGVPIVPGVNEVKDLEQAKLAAEQIGYPVMLKASAGGGGLGMQVCQNEAELQASFPTLQKKAASYFGDDCLFLEKWLSQTKHIEVQIVADQLRVTHLFERDCSVQRRNQKVIEESLAPSIRPQTREYLYEMAVRAAEAVQYTGVGTVEFLVDEQEQIYFLEMNTRLQVEHTITESITGLDLVALQIHLIEGNHLPDSIWTIRPQGHAFQFRIYAEDPETFYPSPGTIQTYRIPQDEGIRMDSGVELGSIVSPYYDPLIAKCIVHADSRVLALTKSKRALTEFEINGIKTNIPLLLRILEEQTFVQGNYRTNLLEKSKTKG
ncbi:ATP-grasp domain-containing protein [Hazenella sp. IB182357]|uniref:biotin carboxylase n=1 Tax=Polycladospora coralii TaxID=2771432 RepID=A0A926N7U0_9BACL|nr:ATP-grasp domain-containing protein [Polycladospora coralii]MBS7530270.1 ATP-grasp domain-containing protein [Polycladospora coralii]